MTDDPRLEAAAKAWAKVARDHARDADQDQSHYEAALILAVLDADRAFLGEDAKTEDWVKAIDPIISSLEEIYGAVFGRKIGDEPNIFSDYDRACYFAGRMRRALDSLNELISVAQPIINTQPDEAERKEVVPDRNAVCEPRHNATAPVDAGADPPRIFEIVCPSCNGRIDAVPGSPGGPWVASARQRVANAQPVSKTEREAAAEAIYERRRADHNSLQPASSRHNWTCPWSDWPPYFREGYYRDAEAALEAAAKVRAGG